MIGLIQLISFAIDLMKKQQKEVDETKAQMMKLEQDAKTKNQVLNDVLDEIRKENLVGLSIEPAAHLILFSTSRSGVWV